MKVQLAAEDVEVQMHEISNLIISRTAVAAEEAGHMRAELATISNSVDDLSQRAIGHERSYAADVARLQGLDSVKRRMLAAKSTLKVGGRMGASYHEMLPLYPTCDLTCTAQLHDELSQSCALHSSRNSMWSPRYPQRCSYATPRLCCLPQNGLR
jgi:hypothetical protein